MRLETVSLILIKEYEGLYMRGYFQHDENDCGLACICTVCKVSA